MALVPEIAAAAVAAAGTYLDTRLSIRSDIGQLRGAKRLQKYIKDLSREHGGNDWSFYLVLHSTFAENHPPEKEHSSSKAGAGLIANFEKESVDLPRHSNDWESRTEQLWACSSIIHRNSSSLDGHSIRLVQSRHRSTQQSWITTSDTV